MKFEIRCHKCHNFTKVTEKNFGKRYHYCENCAPKPNYKICSHCLDEKTAKDFVAGQSRCDDCRKQQNRERDRVRQKDKNCAVCGAASTGNRCRACCRIQDYDPNKPRWYYELNSQTRNNVECRCMECKTTENLALPYEETNGKIVILCENCLSYAYAVA